MVGACSTHGIDDMHKNFLFENLKERDHLEDLGLDVQIILKLILKK
jgi:hypothetical protein